MITERQIKSMYRANRDKIRIAIKALPEQGSLEVGFFESGKVVISQPITNEGAWMPWSVALSLSFDKRISSYVKQDESFKEQLIGSLEGIKQQVYCGERAAEMNATLKAEEDEISEMFQELSEQRKQIQEEEEKRLLWEIKGKEY